MSFFSSGLFFGLPIFSVSVLRNLQGSFDILSSFLGFVLRTFCLYSDSVDFSYSEGSFLLFSSRIFRATSTVLFFFLVLFFLAGLHCLLRMQAVNSCVGDTWQRLWRDDFTHNGKQVVNRPKIPQGLSTLMFRRWSEVPSRGGVRCDSPQEKQTRFTKTWHFDCLFSFFVVVVFLSLSLSLSPSLSLYFFPPFFSLLFFFRFLFFSFFLSKGICLGLLPPSS